MIPPAPNCSRASSMSIRSSGTRTSAASEAPRRDRMADDRIIRVLEEIRDLQRQHIERYGEALRNQQESIRLQQAGLRRVRVILGFAAVVLVLAVGVLILLLLRVVARVS